MPKVEIVINGEWQWMGVLTEDNLNVLSVVADALSDVSVTDD